MNIIGGITRPDLAFETAKLSEKLGKASINNMKQAAALTKKAKDKPLKIKIGRLGELEKMKLLVYASASIATLQDQDPSEGCSYGGKFGDNRSCAPMVWGRSKARIPIIVITHLHSMDDVILSINSTKEEPHWIDGTALRQEEEQGQILIARQAEAGAVVAPFVKKYVNAESLRAVLETGQNGGISVKIFGIS